MENSGKNGSSYEEKLLNSVPGPEFEYQLGFLRSNTQYLTGNKRLETLRRRRLTWHQLGVKSTWVIAKIVGCL